MRPCVNPRVDLTACIGTHGDRLRQLYFRGRIAARSGDPNDKMMRTPPRITGNTEKENENGKMSKNQKKEKETVEMLCQNSRKILRPPAAMEKATPGATVPPEDGYDRIGQCGSLRAVGQSVRSKEKPPESLNTGTEEMLTPTNLGEQASEQDQRSFTKYSPRQEQIARMRAVEEDSLKKCVAVLRKMEIALERQRNVSKDIKDGVGELNEQMDVIASCRRTWIELELNRSQEAEKASRRNKENLLKLDERETPLTVRAKRPASSPAVPDTLKKARENGEEGWKCVTYRKKKQGSDTENKTPVTAPKKNRRRERTNVKKVRKESKKLPEAVLIKSTDGKTYAEVLKDLRSAVKPEDAEVSIRSVRKTKSGSILLELAEGGSKERFCEAIKTSLKEKVIVSTLRPKTTIEIRDMDALSEPDEVTTAVRELIERPNEEMFVYVTRANMREQRRAFVTMSTEAAEAVLNRRRIKVGWTYCRMRKVENVKRCYKCFGVGHTQQGCKGPDRKGEGICIRCGKIGHKMKECTNSPQCCICVAEGRGRVDHIPGTLKCPAYSEASRA